MNTFIILKIESYLYNFHDFVVQIKRNLSIKFFNYCPYSVDVFDLKTTQNVINHEFSQIVDTAVLWIVECHSTICKVVFFRSQSFRFFQIDVHKSTLYFFSETVARTFQLAMNDLEQLWSNFMVDSWTISL